MPTTLHGKIPLWTESLPPETPWGPLQPSLPVHIAQIYSQYLVDKFPCLSGSTHLLGGHLKIWDEYTSRFDKKDIYLTFAHFTKIATLASGPYFLDTGLLSICVGGTDPAVSRQSPNIPVVFCRHTGSARLSVAVMSILLKNSDWKGALFKVKSSFIYPIVFNTQVRLLSLVSHSSANSSTSSRNSRISLLEV